MFSNRKWVILTASEAESIDFSLVMQTSVDTLSWNANHTKTYVKYDGSKPRFLYGKDTLTHSEILTELKTSGWLPTDDDDPEPTE